VKKVTVIFFALLVAVIVIGGIIRLSHRIHQEAIDAALPPDPPIVHVLIGRWTYPIDGRAGFIREYRADGTATVWWPDGKKAAEGTFFVVDTNTIGAQFANRETELVHLINTNTVQIDHVELTGHRKFYAQRQQ
jgi:hypothetical protein